MSTEEIKLSRAVLDAVLYLLSRMEFSQEEGSIELDVSAPMRRLMDDQSVYEEWLTGDYLYMKAD
jgi:hypothetical protein